MSLDEGIGTMRGWVIGLGVAAAALVGNAATAHTHHGRHAHHGSSPARHLPSHHSSARHPAKDEGRKGHARPARPEPAGFNVTTVPGAGMKLRCAPGRSPLLIRKMTQGSGTTVTVICR
jgi:hypothetical protein